MIEQKLALGMIETYGLPALIAAADAAAKTADVKVTMYETVAAGVGFGVGVGVTHGTDHLLVKMIIGRRLNWGKKTK